MSLDWQWNMAQSLSQEDLQECPTIFELFNYYNQLYFKGQLGACSVEWSSKRMTMCAGICEFSGGGCKIKLSEPLLKLRPVRDLKDTLLHEMIHALLFLKLVRHDGHDGHGPKFQAIMHSINKSTVTDIMRPPGGYKITVYHTMYREVDSYRQHWWKCNKCCRLVKRSMNRAPQEADCRRRGNVNTCKDAHCMWHVHLRTCGGTFVKIKEPEGYKPKTKKGGGGPGVQKTLGGGKSGRVGREESSGGVFGPVVKANAEQQRTLSDLWKGKAMVNQTQLAGSSGNVNQHQQVAGVSREYGQCGGQSQVAERKGGVRGDGVGVLLPTTSSVNEQLGADEDATLRNMESVQQFVEQQSVLMDIYAQSVRSAGVVSKMGVGSDQGDSFDVVEWLLDETGAGTRDKVIEQQKLLMSMCIGKGNGSQTVKVERDIRDKNRHGKDSVGGRMAGGGAQSCWRQSTGCETQRSSVIDLLQRNALNKQQSQQYRERLENKSSSQRLRSSVVDGMRSDSCGKDQIEQPMNCCDYNASQTIDLTNGIIGAHVQISARGDNCKCGQQGGGASQRQGYTQRTLRSCLSMSGNSRKRGGGGPQSGKGDKQCQGRLYGDGEVVDLTGV